jgi:hypothetical protein
MEIDICIGGGIKERHTVTAAQPFPSAWITTLFISRSQNSSEISVSQGNMFPHIPAS